MMTDAQPITVRNRVVVSIGCYNLLDPTQKSGSVTFHLSPDGPGESHVSFRISEEKAAEFKGITDPAEVIAALFEWQKERPSSVRSWDDKPSVAQLHEYLTREDIGERDEYLRCCAELPEIDKKIETLTATRDRMQRTKIRYEAAQSVQQMHAAAFGDDAR